MTGVHTGVRPGLRASPIPGSELQTWALTPWPREDMINNRSRALFPGPERSRRLTPSHPNWQAHIFPFLCELDKRRPGTRQRRDEGLRPQLHGHPRKLCLLHQPSRLPHPIAQGM